MQEKEARINVFAQNARTCMKIKGNNQEKKSQNIPLLNSGTVADHTGAQ